MGVYRHNMFNTNNRQKLSQASFNIRRLIHKVMETQQLVVFSVGRVRDISDIAKAPLKIEDIAENYTFVIDVFLAFQELQKEHEIDPNLSLYWLGGEQGRCLGEFEIK